MRQELKRHETSQTGTDTSNRDAAARREPEACPAAMGGFAGPRGRACVALHATVPLGSLRAGFGRSVERPLDGQSFVAG